MKKIISIALAVLLLLTTCLLCTSCDKATNDRSATYKQLGANLSKTVGYNEPVTLSKEDADVYMIMVLVEDTDVSKDRVLLQAAQNGDANYIHLIQVVLSDDAESASVNYYYLYGGQYQTSSATIETISVSNYKTSDKLTFNTTSGFSDDAAVANAEAVTSSLLGQLISATDDYCAGSTGGDLGGAFSLARLKLAGTMIVVGMCMIFLVLAILWGVLIIFKKALYKEDGETKGKKVQEEAKEAPTAAAPDNEAVAAIAGAMAYAEDDGAVVAAITAAIAEMIASDENLSREFAGGFKVVSFRKKSGKGAWNK